MAATGGDRYFLQSERLGFRAWQPGDVELAVRLWGNPEVTRFIAKAPLSHEEIVRKLESEVGRPNQYWPMFLRDTNDFVGCAGLRDREIDVPELGAHVLPEFWRKGLANEACRCVIRHAFDEDRARAIFAGHNPSNTASRSLLLALGFRHTHDELYAPTGLEHPSYLLDVDVRPVRWGDVPDVVDLVRDVLAEFGLEFGKNATTDDELGELPGSYDAHGGAFWVAMKDGEMLGTCGVFPVGDHTLELRKMYLRPSSRGLRIGKRLLDEAIRFAKSRDAKRIVLDTTERMERAIAFYEANGFVRDDAQKRASRCSRGYVRDL